MAADDASISASALITTSTASTENWQSDLKRLFDQAKERFPDVVWELTSDYDGNPQEEVWGHKGMCSPRPKDYQVEGTLVILSRSRPFLPRSSNGVCASSPIIPCPVL